MIRLRFFRLRMALCLLGLVAALPGYAAVVTSTGSGNWSNAAIWDQVGGPVAGDDVIIATGHTITVNLSAPQFNSIAVNSGGKLTFNFLGTIFITGDIANNGDIDMVNGLLTGNGTDRTINNGSGGLIILDFCTFDPAGTIDLVNLGTFSKRGFNGGYVDFHGTFTNEASGTVSVAAAKAMSFAGDFINNGTVNLITNSSLRFLGANVTVNTGSSITQLVPGNGNLVFGGTVNVTGNTDFVVDIPNVVHGGATLVGSGIGMVVDAGVTYNMDNGWIDGFTSLTNNGNMDLSGVFVKRITMDVTNNGTLDFSDGALSTNGPTTTFTNTATGTLDLNGGNIDFINFVNQGVTNLSQNQAISTDFDNEAGATVNLSSNQTYSASGNFINNGAVTGSGTLNIASSGVLSGTGSFTGNSFATIAGGGTMSPGQSPGCMSFANNYTQSGTLEIEVNGTTACTNFDQITVGGTADLGVTSVLDLSFLGFLPNTNDEFTIIDANTLTGTFASDNLPADWNVQYDYPNAGEVTLQYTGPGQGTACDNLAGTSPLTYIDTGVGSWGQTYTPTVACEGTNDLFESITFERDGNGSAVFTLEIFDGATLSGTPNYTQTGLSTTQAGGDPTWNLAGGTGDRSFVIGQTYTFLFTKTGGSGVFILRSNSVTSGQAIENSTFLPAMDLRFGINSTSSTPPALDFNVGVENSGPSNTVIVPIWVNNFNGIVNYQGTIVFDPAVLTFVEATSPQIGGPVIVNNFGEPGQGTIPTNSITFLWADLLSTQQTLTDGTFVINVEFTVNANATTGFTPVSIDGSVTPLGYSDDPNAISLLTPTVQNGGVNIDADPPVTVDVNIVSNNANDITLATVGDVITLTFTTDETPAITPVVTITKGGAGAITVTGSGTSWTATKTVAAGDDGLVTFDIELEDQYGNTSNTTATTDGSSVTVDTEVPVITCPANVPQDTDAGVCSADVTFADATATDNLAGVSVAQIGGPVSGSTFSVGTTAITYEATDAAGNTSTCSFDVIVTDNEAPTVVTQPVTIQLDAAGSASVTAAQVDNGSSDACGIASLALDIISFDCSNTGANTVTLTVTDNNGNVSTGTAVVTVEDNIAPTIVCPGPQTLNTDLGLCTATLPDLTGLATVDDNCPGGGGNVNANTASQMAVGYYHTLSIADDGTLWAWGRNDYGQLGTGTASSVDQTTPLQVSTDTDWAAVAGGYFHSVALRSDGTLWAWGQNTNGQLGIGSTIQQNSPTQVGTATDWVSVRSGYNHCFAIKADGTLWAWGWNSDGQLGIGNNTQQNSPVQVGTDTDWVLVDAGYSHTVALKSNGTAWAWGSNGSGRLGIGSTIQQSSPIQIGIDTDWASISAGADHSVGLKNNGTLWVWGANGSGQLGDPVFLSSQLSPIQVGSDTDWAVAEAGSYHTMALKSTGTLWVWGIRTYSIIGDGNTSGSQTTPLQVGTNTNWTQFAEGCFWHVIASQSDNSLYGWGFNSDGQVGDGSVNYYGASLPVAVAGFTPGQSGGGSGGGSGSLTVTQLPAAGSALAVGANTVTITVTDPSGNATSCDVTVTVEDNEDPTVVTQPFTAQLDATGNVTITPADVDNASSDPCGIASYSLDVTDFTCANVGANTVTLTVTDNNGNSASATAVVTVEDNEDPTVVTQPFTAQLDATGNVTITPADVDNASSDPCGIASYSLDVTAFTCANVGANTVTLTVTDNNGNSASATAVVTVEDNVDPTVVTQPFTAQLDATGNVTITPADVNNGSSDACGIATYSLDVTDFTCANVGANTVTLTVTDVNGNSASATAVVTVEDNVDPTVVTQPFTAQLDATGNVTITPADVNNGSSDACGIATYSLDVTDFTCANVGANTVTLTVTDVNGNSASATAVVTVEDNVDPTVVTQPFTAQLDATGNVTITPADVDNGSSDACGIASYSLDVTDFTCANVGTPVTVTMTVTDNNGNSASATAVVTVEDNVDPTVVTQPYTVQLDAAGNGSIVVADVNNGSSDACGIASTSLDITSLDCSNVGANTVTLTVTDVNGNVSTGTAVVTVEDNVNPVAVAQAISVDLDGNGTATITPAQIDNGSSDACGIATYALDVTSFDCNTLGANTVTLTVTDNNGNSHSATAVVTVNLVPAAAITGQAATEDNKVVAGVTFDVNGTDGPLTQLGSPAYSFLLTPCTSVNDIGGFKNNDADPKNGIDVQDITKMTRHILNIEALGSPYKLLAADVNHNSLINGPDVTQVRQMVLGVRTGFPTPGATVTNPVTDDYLWSFIPQAHTWVDNTMPWTYPTRIDFLDPVNTPAQDFVGVKLGDVNNTWDETNPLTTWFADSIHMVMQDQATAPGQVVTIPVMVRDFDAITGYQFSMNWDPSVLSLESAENTELFGFFNTELAKKGILSTVWNDLSGQPITMEDDAVAFTLTFRVVGDWGSTSGITVTSDLTNAIGYNVEEMPLAVISSSVRITVGDVSTSIDPAELEGYAFLQNVPNPFNESTTFTFALPTQEDVKIEIYNGLGQIVRTFEGTYGVGAHEVEWNGTNSASREVAQGIYSVRIQAGIFQSAINVKKMQ